MDSTSTSSSALSPTRSETAVSEAPTSTDGSSMPVPPVAENLSWAAAIKEHHRHLQSAVAGAGAAAAAVSPPQPHLPQQRRATEGTSTAASPPSPLLPYEKDLQRWREALDGVEAAQRLCVYATAMHHLATHYWDLNTTASDAEMQLKTFSDAVAPENQQSKARRSVLDASSAPRIGEKRPRDALTVPSVRTPLSTPNGTTTAAGGAAKAPHRYSDRLQYCLQSVASYYLGETVATTSSTERCATAGSNDTGGRNSLSSAEAQTAAVPGQHHPHPQQGSPPLLIPVNGTVYMHLPGVFARVVKPLRRAFFDVYQRMATGEEVGALVEACKADGAVPHTNTAAATRAADLSGLPPSAAVDALPTCESGVALVGKLLSTHPEGLRAQGESTWRRGAGTAWAAALRYTFPTTSHATGKQAHHSDAAPSLPPPLYVLDVGACYGPFYGQCLPRPSLLPPVPLRVTSIDLAPYLEEEHSALDNLRDPPSPRVWQGDWLDMKFFSPEDEECFSLGNEGMRRAEGGRVRYRVPSQSDLLAANRQESRAEDRVGTKDRTGADSSACLVSSATSSLAAGHPENTVHTDPLSVVSLQLESYDAVFFCFLLSYMPTPRLRFLACLHACLALNEGGLLVIASTRTQGSRRRNWVQEWTACLSTIGLLRVQQSTQEKVVGMAFVKVCPSKEVHDRWKTAEGRNSWIRAMMTTVAAENGLRITADDAQTQADV
ncbi:HUS1 protein putative (HUS1) [Leptomonas pyrrhocoris]|uniref:HUS1 protein putative (HUS1) n=1 Tax=Leptomonas pyrrhocoris TaxID=157538 RepID=A0A0M9G708_LEPPY|nr:HUS1 protein putative (HUS1) [Leptomonas pyrrhocoris]KPA83900.1 HUS1 protein putative (HUS1) [Leptomonas pyrrhocoris]|eukprot:XP_015662339.1 HUS1 protein putative (HUS1) [Leptomonas pyrrhocoris]